MAVTGNANTKLDHRRNAFREDIAAEYLRDVVRSPRYVKGQLCQISSAAAQLRRAPEFTAPLETEALYGETVFIYEQRDGWAWAQLTRDRYTGYLPANTLTTSLRHPTHRITALRTYVYPVPDIKVPPRGSLSMNALITPQASDGKFLKIDEMAYVYARHTVQLTKFSPDFVAVATRFLGAPYLWGGRQNTGIDCSGLVQIALESSGIAAPRDTDMQAAELGKTLSDEDIDLLMRGDLVFWDGHVGIMVDESRLLHANAYHMETVIEPLENAMERIEAAEGKQITTIRRLPALGRLPNNLLNRTGTRAGHTMEEAAE